MRATNDVIRNGKPASAVLLPIVMLAAFTLGSVLIAIRRLRFEDRNVGWN